ncbi:hypothetical protein BGZ83_011967, partial [Gryganskiella cystojenkinii]
NSNPDPNSNNNSNNNNNNSKDSDITLSDQDDEGDRLRELEDDSHLVKTETDSSAKSETNDPEESEDPGDQEDNKEDSEEVAPWEPITETVREVFERMLEQRSLLIVKNRARGLLEPEEEPKNAANSTTDESPSPSG